MLGPADEAFPLHRNTRPPDAGSTSVFMDFIAATTDAGVTPPVRFFVPRLSAATLWNTTIPVRSAASVLPAPYFLRTFAYSTIDGSGFLAPTGASDPNCMPLMIPGGTAWRIAFVTQNEIVVIVPL